MFSNKRRLLIVLFVVLALAAIGITIYIVRQQQETRSRASEDVQTQILSFNQQILSFSNKGRGQQSVSDAKVIESVAIQRKELMKQLAQDDPQAFLNSAFPQDKRENLPSYVQSLIEKPVEISGELIIHDVHTIDKNGYGYFLYREDKDTLDAEQKDSLSPQQAKELANSNDSYMQELFFADGTPDLSDGNSNFSVEGVQLDSSIVVSDYQSDTNPSDSSVSQSMSSTSSTPQNYTIAVVPIDFAFSFNAPTLEDFNSNATAQYLFGPESKLVSQIKELSKNRVNIKGFVVPKQVVSLIADPRLVGDCRNVWKTMDYVIGQSITESMRRDFPEIHTVAIIIPDRQGCAAGAGTLGPFARPDVGKIIINGWENNDFHVSLLIHELGHNLGLPHANLASCKNTTLSDGCKEEEYGDNTDVMGIAQPSLSKINAYGAVDLDYLSWIDTDAIAEINTSGEYTVLSLLSDSPVSPNTKKIFKIKLNKGYVITNDETKKSREINELIINYKPDVGIYSYISSWNANGIQMLGRTTGLENKNNAGVLLFPVTTPGRRENWLYGLTLKDKVSFFLPENKLSIKQSKHTNDAATITVNMNEDGDPLKDNWLWSPVVMSPLVVDDVLECDGQGRTSINTHWFGKPEQSGGEGFYTIDISPTIDFKDIMNKKVYFPGKENAQWYDYGIPLQYEGVGTNYKMEGFEPYSKEFNLIVGLTYYVRVYVQQKWTEGVEFTVPQCQMGAPVNMNPNTTLLGNSLITIHDTSSNKDLKAVQLKGIAKSFLSPLLYAPVFYVNYFGYHSMAFISNPNPQSASVVVKAYKIDSGEFIEEITLSLDPNKSQQISLGSNNPLIRNILQKFMPTDRTKVELYPRISLEILSDKPLLGSIVNFSKVAGPRWGCEESGLPKDCKDPDPEWKNLQGDTDKFIRQVNSVDGKSVQEWADTLRKDITNPVDFLADTLIPGQIASKVLVINQAVKNFSSYSTGMNIMNISETDQDFRVTVSKTDGSIIKTYDSPFMGGGSKPLRPKENRVLYLPSLARVHGEFPDGFNGNITIEATNGEDVLIGTNYYSRYSEKEGRGSASFWDGSYTDATQCGYDFPLFNFDSYNISQTGGKFRSGLAIMSGKKEGNTGSIAIEAFSQKTSDKWLETRPPLSATSNLIFYLPNNMPDQARDKTFATRTCGTYSSKLLTSGTTLREDVDGLSYLNFASNGFSENWLSDTFYVPYFSFKYGNRVLDIRIMPFNAGNRDIYYTGQRNGPGGAGGLYTGDKGRKLEPKKFNQDVHGPDADIEYGFFKIQQLSQ